MWLGRRFGRVVFWHVVFGDSAGFQEILVIIRLAPFPIFGAGAKFQDGGSAVRGDVARGAEISRMMGTATAATRAEDEAHSYFMNDSNDLMYSTLRYVPHVPARQTPMFRRRHT